LQAEFAVRISTGPQTPLWLPATSATAIRSWCAPSARPRVSTSTEPLAFVLHGTATMKGRAQRPLLESSTVCWVLPSIVTCAS
jgi:hypothetical protein